MRLFHTARSLVSDVMEKNQFYISASFVIRNKPGKCFIVIISICYHMSLQVQVPFRNLWYLLTSLTIISLSKTLVIYLKAS